MPRGRRLNLSDDVIGSIIVLGSYGFAAKFIQQHIYKHYRKRIKLWSVYSILRRGNTSIRAYRNGATPEAETILAGAMKVQTIITRSRRSRENYASDFG